MAILKGAFEEEILPKSQRVIVKAIYKMSQLNETKIALAKVVLKEADSWMSAGKRLTPDLTLKARQVQEYLDSNIENILNSIKLPKPKD